MKATVLICVFLFLVCIFSIRSYIKRLKSGCCGARGGKSQRKVRVADRNRRHYPIVKILYVDGMICGNCARKVENSLNRLDGVWAAADPAAGMVRVRIKKDLEDGVFDRAVRESGYVLLSVKQEAP